MVKCSALILTPLVREVTLTSFLKESRLCFSIDLRKIESKGAVLLEKEAADGSHLVAILKDDFSIV